MKYFLLGSLLILTTLCTGTMAVGYNENCTINENCTDSNTRCLNSLCVCNDNYQYINNICITAPTVNITSEQYSQVIGGDITIPCTVSGDATSAYWTFTDGGSEQNITSSGRYSVSDLPKLNLTITSLNTTDAGTYKCKASNGAGETSDTATLDITGGLPTVAIQSQYTKLIGESVTIPCTVSGTPVVLTIEWTFTPTSGNEQTLTPNSRHSISGLPNPQLTISSLEKSDSGSYTCRATSAAGQSSKSTTLSVGGGNLTVSIIQPQITKIGEDVTISCSWSGQPNATDVKWNKNDSLLDISNSNKYSGGNVAVPSLTIKSVTHSDAGLYQCFATNAAGTAESSKTTLTIRDRQFGDTCSGNLPCDDNKNLECVNTKCQCKDTHYVNNNTCSAKKQLNEACNDNVILCVSDSQVICNGSHCVCDTGYYDNTGSSVGGSCEARKSLGYSCNETVLCLENIRCASDNKCRCPDNFYDDNKETLNGTCKNISELKVMTFNLTATTDAITVTWTPPSVHSYISRYEVRWRVNNTGSTAFSTASAGTANTYTINQNLKAGQAYDVYIESVDNYTQVAEQKVASDRKIVRLKPNTPGNITNPGTLDAPKINLNWTASPNSIVTKYTVTVVEKNATESTTDNTPSLTLQMVLVPGVYYTIRITAVSGGPTAPGGETVSEVHEERIRTMVEKPGLPLNVACPMNPKDRSLAITWSPPNDPNGIIQHYKVRVFYANGSLKEENQTKGANLTFNVQNLTPESTFGFAVSAVNDGTEDGDWSNPIYCETKAALSEKPLSLDVSNTGSRNFTVTFNKPATTNGRLTGYVVFVYEEEETPQKCVQQILFRCSDCGNNYTFIKPNSTCSGKEVYQDISNLPDTPSVSYMVIDLLPYMDYKVEAAGINAAGEGNLAKIPNFIQTEQEVPNKPNITAVADIMATSVKLKWTIEGPKPGPTNITVTVYEFNGSVPSMNRTHVLESAFSRTEYTVQNLEEYWNYQFTVAAATVIGSVTSDMSAVIRTLPTAPGKVLDLGISKISQDNYTAVHVTWKIPPLHQRNSYLEKYVIKNNFTSRGNLVEISVDYNQETNTEVFGVTPETCYSVEVYTKNNESSNSIGEISQMDYCAPAGPPQSSKIENIVTTNTGGEQAQTSMFVVELNVDLFNDNTNGRVVFYGIAVCKSDKCQNQPQLGASSSVWRNLQNYQTAKGKGFPLYRATDERFIQTVSNRMSQGRRKRATSLPYTIGSETCANNSNSYYCNGPLPPDTSFSVVVFICTAGGCTHTDPFGPYKTMAEEEETQVWIYIVAVLAAVIVFGLVIGVILFVRHRRRKPSTQKSYRDFNDVDNESNDAEMEKIERNRPILLSEINEVVATKHKDSNLLFAREYEELKNISPKHPAESSELDANKLKNRYVNILPFDHSRVKLLPTDDEPDSDFINANYLPGYKLQREYIGAQGPIPGTVDDFWRMIWEQNVGIVIMLTLCKEDGRVKCEPYWPMDLHEVKQYGEITVETVNVSTVNTYDFRIFKLKLGNENRSLKHFHFLQWKDFSANVQNDTMIEFIKNVRSHIQPPDKNGPIIVHCSAGVGRTGTFIALDHLIQFIDDHEFDASIDIFDLVLKLRENRMFMVQTEQQYIFIHDVVRDYLERKRKAQQGEDLYQNVNLAFEPDENLYENYSSKKTEL